MEGGKVRWKGRTRREAGRKDKKEGRKAEQEKRWEGRTRREAQTGLNMQTREKLEKVECLLFSLMLV